jgi:hypothetical protein
MEVDGQLRFLAAIPREREPSPSIEEVRGWVLYVFRAKKSANFLIIDFY